MTRSLDTTRFKFEEKCRDEDIDEIAKILLDTSQDQPEWSLLLRSTPRDELLEWVGDAMLRPRLTNPHQNIFLIRELSTGLPRAYACMKWPNDQKSTHADDFVSSRALLFELAPPTVNQKLLTLLVAAILSGTKHFGYDSKVHFHREGIAVHPDFQRHGLGSFLTKQLNDIADKYDAGRATFATVRPKGQPMFKSLGYKECGKLKFDLREYGGPEDFEKQYFRRDPPGVQGTAKDEQA